MARELLKLLNEQGQTAPEAGYPAAPESTSLPAPYLDYLAVVARSKKPGPSDTSGPKTTGRVNE